MEFVGEQAAKGVLERAFVLQVDGEKVPGIAWTPEGPPAPRPVVLLGHGGTQHKRAPNVLGLARRFVRHLGFAAVAIDAPGHGERVIDEVAAARARANLERRIAAGPGGAALELGPEEVAAWAERTRRGVAEWKATLDAIEADGHLSDGMVGYWGLSMGTAIGLPFVASEPRIRAAVLGLAGLRGGIAGEGFEKAARSLEVPVLLVFQWDDELISRQAGLDLFDAIGSSSKVMHIHPGGHVETPLYEREVYDMFFRSQLSH